MATARYVSLMSIDATALIAADARALIAAASVDPDAAIEHAPGWTTTDLLRHIAHVHWAWATVVETPILTAEQFREHPDVEFTQDPATDAREQAERLVRVLDAADLDAPCYFWSADPQFHTVGAIRRHQVQETAVHRWDAQHATGTAEPIDRDAALDAIDEFLTVSIITGDAPEEWRSGVAMGAPLVLETTDADASWVVLDEAIPGVVAAQPGPYGTPEPGQVVTVRGTASDLLLWIYDRVHLQAEGDDADGVVQRFRGVSSTD